MMDPRRYPSDALSNGSTRSVWSTTESESFVYTDDPDWAPWWGYDGVRGAVTRKDDRRDDRRVRVAAHFLRGPFAGYKSKKHSSHRHHHHRDSDSQSSYSSSSGSSSSSRRHRHFSPGPSAMPPPAHANPASPHMHYQEPPPQFGHFPQAPPMGMYGHRPPPPPPAMAGPPPRPGFEAGFIQVGGGGGPPPQRDPVWGHDAQYNGEPEVWD
ncbi:hypothetical protein F5B22DRAFT_522139 [Xylaria bambusicola]|uniref:uncharacterized protein n=1 Tax=Xylaria bambusicola TaxID=326684 RepID=UPI002007C9FC|nr:uncharacterized protein F5B22DRAFT_522139 [Xylaria bambusicola]KAI0505503.1 hypothetical protein F5B22DRAFT_522139 [Xylaria bambusicola]